MGGKSGGSTATPPPTPTPDVDVATTAAEKALVAAQKDSYASSTDKKPGSTSALGSTGATNAAGNMTAGAGGARRQRDMAANIQGGAGNMGASAVLTG